jgi:hypothetical protein
MTKQKHCTCEYNGKVIVMDYIKDPKEEFKFACMRIVDNKAEGIVTTPKGLRYEVSYKNRNAKLIK